LFAGAAGAVAAGGAAAYMKREQISEGMNWVSSHLAFVNRLARPEEMKKRLAAVSEISSAQHIGFLNMYTTLGRAVDEKAQNGWTGKVLGKDRTFCNVPKGDMKKHFVPAVNDKSTAETLAHTSMFEPKNNPGYYSMSEQAKDVIVQWAQNSWYEESEGPGLYKGLEDEAEMVETPEDEEFEDLKRPESL
jgi:hypothetical protein